MRTEGGPISDSAVSGTLILGTLCVILDMCLGTGTGVRLLGSFH